VGDGGGAGSFAVSTSPGCAWTAASRAPWITIAGASSGTGAGAVNFSVTGNPMGLPPRSGIISVNEQTFTVNQSSGVPCVYTLTPTSQEFSAGAGSGSFSVATVLTCPWTASSNDPWITITGPGGAG